MYRFAKSFSEDSIRVELYEMMNEIATIEGHKKYDLSFSYDPRKSLILTDRWDLLNKRLQDFLMQWQVHMCSELTAIKDLQSFMRSDAKLMMVYRMKQL